MKIKVISDAPRMTKKIAKEFLQEALKVKKKGAHVFLLKGDLGSGKTTFALGLLAYLGIRPKAASPTFVIMKRYGVGKTNLKKNAKQAISNIWHIDAYRLRSKKDLDGLRVPFEEKGSLIIVEWPQRAKLSPPEGSYVISFMHGLHERERIMEITCA